MKILMGAVPGAVIAVQTFGDFLGFHPNGKKFLMVKPVAAIGDKSANKAP